jgi:LPXTG-motif cell wall-anchored protein
MSNKIYMMDIPLTGRELADGETATIEMNVPDGFDTNMLWVLRINDDGTATKCDITSVADGKLQFVTDKLCKFAIVQMTYSSSKLPKTGVVDTGYFLILGGLLLAGGVVLLRKKAFA